MITILDKDQIKKFDIRSVGSVATIQSDSLSIQPFNGDQMYFLFDEDTRWKGKGVFVEGVGDIEPGMKVMIAANQMDDGKLLAKIVLVFRQWEVNPN